MTSCDDVLGVVQAPGVGPVLAGYRAAGAGRAVAAGSLGDPAGAGDRPYGDAGDGLTLLEQR